MKIFSLCILFLFNFSGKPLVKTVNHKPLLESPECIGQRFSKFKVKRANGATFSNANLKHKIAFITFWQGASPYCVGQLEAFNEMFDKLKARNNFIFVSFSPDTDSTINEIVNKHDIRYNFLHADEMECLRLSHGFGFPSSFVLDKDGKILYYFPSSIITNKESAKNVVSAEYNKILEYL